MSVALVITAGLLAAAPTQAFTSTADVHVCAFDHAATTVVAGTSGGLAVHTAASTRVVTSIEGLPGTRVNALLPAAEQRWWVGTDNGLAQVAVTDDGLDVLASVDGPPIRAIGRDDAGIVVGTWGSGVMRYVGGALRAVPYAVEHPGASSRRVTALQRFKGRWQVGTAGAGVWIIDGDQLAPTNTLDDAIVWSLAATERELWVGTLEGVFRGDSQLRRTSTVDARSLRLDGQRVDIGTLGDGLVTLDIGTGSTRSKRDWSGRTIRGVARRGRRRCVATDDGLWLDEGPGTDGLFALQTGPVSNDISALASDGQGGLWVGTFDRGLSYRDAGGWHTIDDPAVDPQINAITVQQTAEGSVAWVATARGLTRIEGNDVQTLTRKAKIPHEHVLSVLSRADGTLVVGTARGFVEVVGDRVQKPERARKAERWAVWSLAEDAAGTLWLGTTAGLIAWPKTGPWRRYTMIDGTLPDNWVTAIQTDGDALWVGTYAGGVVHLERGTDGELHPTELGGGRINPAGITLTKDHVYASTMGGLLRRPRSPEGDWTNQSRHAPGKDTKSVLQTDDGLWVATRRGLALMRR